MLRWRRLDLASTTEQLSETFPKCTRGGRCRRVMRSVDEKVKSCVILWEWKRINKTRFGTKRERKHITTISRTFSRCAKCSFVILTSASSRGAGTYDTSICFSGGVKRQKVLNRTNSKPKAISAHWVLINGRKRRSICANTGIKVYLSNNEGLMGWNRARFI